VLVSWFGAKAYCEFYGWRLPSGAEWEKAARGQDGRPYPWGNEITPQNANYYSSHDVFEKIAGALGDTTPVGMYNGSTDAGYTTLDSPSPYGLYDMAGNVWQWVADIQEGTHYRMLRGGSKADYAYNLRIWTTNSAGPDYASPSIGFRCAR
jgi:formylglycine-generating enzyme required for sulfatase activity